MSAQNIQIKTKKISELDNLQDEKKIANSYIVVSYTENGAKENYKVKIQDLINNASSTTPIEKEYAIHIFANGAKLISQSSGPYLKDTVVSLSFRALDNYQLTNNSCFITNCELISWHAQYGRLNFRITGTGDPVINISAESLLTYIINYSGLRNMYVNILKMSFLKNEEFDIILTPYNGYELPTSASSFSLSGGTIVNYNKTTGKLRIKVIENMILSGEAIEKQKFNININIENSSYTISPNSLSFYENDEFTITLKPNKGYNAPLQLNVTNGTIISYNNGNNGNNGIAKIKVDGTGDINISGTSEYKEIILSVIASNLNYTKSPNQSTYHINENVTIDITPNSGYISPKRSNISVNGCSIVSYENNKLIIKITNDSNVKVTLNAELPEIIETYYFGMTYAGEGYFKEKIVTASTGETLHIFDEENTLISVDSSYITSATNVSPIPYNDFNITNNYQNMFYIPKFTFVAILIPKKYVIKNGDGYLFLDDSNNRYKIQQFGIDVTNFEQLKYIYAEDNIDWDIEVSINNVPHYLLYFKDEGTAGEYKFVKIS